MVKRSGELAQVTAERDALQAQLRPMAHNIARRWKGRAEAAEADGRKMREALDASRCFKDHTPPEAHKCKRCVARAALDPS